MIAKEIMTTKVITVTPDTSVPDIARLLIENSISALPVLNSAGEVIGMVSEGDLTGRSEMQRLERRDWWLNLLAEGEGISSEFITNIHSSNQKAHEIMTSPVVTVSPATDISEIAHLLTEHHIKRVPVVNDNRIVGIVSRADLVRAIAMLGNQAETQQHKHSKNFLTEAFTSIDQHYLSSLHHKPEPVETKSVTNPVNAGGKLSVKDFQGLVANFEHEKVVEKEEAHHKLAELHKQQVSALINHHLNDSGWQTILHHAQEAAQRGEKEYMVLRFPHDLCSDGGRAINVGEDVWPQTLRGEAAEIYLRWEQELKPQGFRMAARILEYPDGFPGDIGIFLVWG